MAEGGEAKTLFFVPDLETEKAEGKKANISTIDTKRRLVVPAHLVNELAEAADYAPQLGLVRDLEKMGSGDEFLAEIPVVLKESNAVLLEFILQRDILEQYMKENEVHEISHENALDRFLSTDFSFQLDFKSLDSANRITLPVEFQRFMKCKFVIDVFKRSVFLLLFGERQEEKPKQKHRNLTGK